MNEKSEGDIADQIIEIIAAEGMIERERLSPDTELASLDIQSADYVMILMAVEEKFGVYISVDSELTDAKTVGELVALVAGRIREGASGAAA